MKTLLTVIALLIAVPALAGPPDQANPPPQPEWQDLYQPSVSPAQAAREGQIDRMRQQEQRFQEKMQRDAILQQLQEQTDRAERAQTDRDWRQAMETLDTPPD
ncbi:MAG TPA: DUF2756 domain-containing protein [Gammaproteobacteria bacterium]|nr:DUF2756 domain-containing protein [Gammaproteobacteria bacterium]